MASADWNSLSDGTGSFVIVADGTAPSPPDVIELNGGQYFQNITGGSFRDSRVASWTVMPAGGGRRVDLILRSLNAAAYSAAPSTYFRAGIVNQGLNVDLTFNAIVAGVVTLIASATVASVNGTTNATWQQFRFSTFNSGTDMLLRLEQWNGAAFVVLLDAAAPIATFPALNAVGFCRFGTANSVGVLTRFDDVAFYSLT